MNWVKCIFKHIWQLLYIDLLLLVKRPSRWDFGMSRHPILFLELPILTLLSTIGFLKAFESILIIIDCLLLWFPVLRRIVAIVNRQIQLLVSLFCEHVKRITHKHLLLKAHSNFFFCFGVEFNHTSDGSAAGCAAHDAYGVPWLLWVMLRFRMYSTRRYCTKRYVAIQKPWIFLLFLLAVVPYLFVREW